MKIKEMYKNNNIKMLFNFIFSLLFVAGFNYYFFYENIFGRESIFNFLLLFFSMYIINQNKDVSFKSKRIPYLFSIIFVFFLLLGNRIYYTDDISTFYNLKIIFFTLITFIGFSKIIGEVIYIIFDKLTKYKFESKKVWKLYKNKYVWLIIWAFIFISWIPAFLTFYPGIFRYDFNYQTFMALNTMPFTKFHPPIHTLIWKLCINYGNFTGLNAGAHYTIPQMLFLSFAYARMIKFFIDKKINNWLILISILFLSINPVIALFSIEMTKDVYFTVFLVLFIVELLELLYDNTKFLNSKKHWALFIIYATLSLLFRNNFSYAYLLFIPIIVIYFRKYADKVLFITVIPCIAYLLINNVIYPLSGIGEGDEREKLNVPIQQIAYVVNKHNDTLSDVEKKQIDNYIDYKKAKEEYNPRFSDPVKNTFKTNYYKKNKKKFYKLWSNIFKNHKSDYISSFLTLNLPFWYIDVHTTETKGVMTYIGIGDQNVENRTYVVSRRYIIPSLIEPYRKVGKYEAMERLPFISTIFSIAFPIWIMIFTIFILIYKKDYKYILPIILLILFWLTYILGPLSCFRYVFPLFSLYPLFIVLIFNSDILNN